MSIAHELYWRGRAEKLAKGLLEIAKLAMPATYFKTDSRCELARETLKELRPKPKRWTKLGWRDVEVKVKPYCPTCRRFGCRSKQKHKTRC